MKPKCGDNSFKFGESNWTWFNHRAPTARQFIFSGSRTLCPASEALPGTVGIRVPADDVVLRVAPAADRSVAIILTELRHQMLVLTSMFRRSFNRDCYGSSTLATLPPCDNGENCCGNGDKLSPRTATIDPATSPGGDNCRRGRGSNLIKRMRHLHCSIL